MSRHTIFLALLLMGACQQRPATPAGGQNGLASIPGNSLVSNAREPSAPQPANIPDPLTTELSASLIRQGLPRPNCVIEVSRGDMWADAAKTQDARRFRAWLESNVVSSSDYNVVRRGEISSWPQGATQDIILRGQDGNELEVKFWDSGHAQLAQITFCAFKVAQVSVLDTTLSGNGKLAEVIFTVDYVATPLADRIGNAGFVFSFSFPPFAQHHAILRRLDATGWQVDSFQ